MNTNAVSKVEAYYFKFSSHFDFIEAMSGDCPCRLHKTMAKLMEEEGYDA